MVKTTSANSTIIAGLKRPFFVSRRVSEGKRQFRKMPHKRFGLAVDGRAARMVEAAGSLSPIDFTPQRQTDDASRMRLLTYNIHKGIGGRDRRYQPRRVADVIEEVNPDLICLQEVTRSARRTSRDNQPAVFREAFRFATLYQMNVRYKQGGYGNLILSRWPLIETHQISLRQREKKPRGAQLALIDTPEGPLHLVNWHLGLSDRERKWQADQLVRHRLFQSLVAHPTLLVGDTNDWRDRLIRGPIGAAQFQHATRPPSRFRTFPAWMPVGSLDKVFACDGVDIHHAHVVHSKLARQASDHLPVVVDFHLREK